MPDRRHVICAAVFLICTVLAEVSAASGPPGVRDGAVGAADRAVAPVPGAEGAVVPQPDARRRECLPEAPVRETAGSHRRTGRDV